MKIELYMTTIEQEFSAETVAHLLKRKNGLLTEDDKSSTTYRNISSNWNNWNNWDNWNNWNNYCADFRPRFNQQPFPNIIERLRLRRESFGGLAFDPVTRRVFKLDNEAYVVTTRLNEGENSTSIAHDIGSLDIDINEIINFFVSFEKVG
jgi:hypothetical protein